MTDQKPRPAKERIIDAIITLQSDHGYPPTKQELAAELHVSYSRVRNLLVELRADGVVDWVDNRARSLHLVRKSEQ